MEKVANFERMGIGKEMNNEFSFIEKSELQKIIESSYFECPLISKRPNKGHFCNVEVIDCQYDDWWYKDLIGLRFFCQIIYTRFSFGEYISEFKGVKLCENKMITFRSFSAKDVIII